jgi:WD40 repeat protein
MPRVWILLTCTLFLGLTAAGGQAQAPARDGYGDPLPPGAVARLGTVRFRHDTPIVFAAFLPDGKRVVSVSSDGLLCVWEFPSGKPIRRLESNRAGERATGTATQVTGATLSPDGKHITVFCDDGFLRIWDWANARQLGKVASVRAAPVAPTPAIARLLRSRALDPLGPVYSPDARTLLLAARVLQFVDLPTGKEVGPSPGHTESLTALSFAPDGQVRTQDAHSTRTWNRITGKELGASPIKLPATLKDTLPRRPALLRAGANNLTISPDGRFGVVTGYQLTAGAAGPAGLIAQGQAHLFDAANGKELGTIEFDIDLNNRIALLVAFSPDSKTLAVGGGDAKPRIELYDVASAKRLRTLGPSAAAPPPGGGGGPKGKGKGRFLGGVSAQQMLFSPDGKAIALQTVQVGPGATVMVLDTATGKQIASLPSVIDGSPATPVAFSPDGRCLALAKSDGTVALWELATGQHRRTYGGKLPLPRGTNADPLGPLGGGGPGGFFVDPVVSTAGANAAISPDGKFLALAGLGGSVHVLDTLTGKELALFKGHTGVVNALAFAPDGKTLASASHDTTALIWDVTRIARPAPPARVLQPGELEKWWEALAGNDAAAAFAALGEFAAAPKAAVAWIRDQVKPAPPLDGKRARELMSQLGDGRYKVRDRATAELLKIGEPMLPVLDEALAREQSPESRRRLEALRGKLTGMGLQGDRLRVFRAVELLERIGTPEARRVLRALAEGAPGALVTTSAQAALKR